MTSFTLLGAIKDRAVLINKDNDHLHDMFCQFFLSQNFFLSKIFFGLKVLSGQHFGAEIFFWKNFFFGVNIFGVKIFGGQNTRPAPLKQLFEI